MSWNGISYLKGFYSNYLKLLKVGYTSLWNEILPIIYTEIRIKKSMSMTSKFMSKEWHSLINDLTKALVEMLLVKLIY